MHQTHVLAVCFGNSAQTFSVILWEANVVFVCAYVGKWEVEGVSEVSALKYSILGSSSLLCRHVVKNCTIWRVLIELGFDYKTNNYPMREKGKVSLLFHESIYFGYMYPLNQLNDCNQGPGL